MLINKYVIEEKLIEGLPQLPYRNGVGAWEGVCLHATAVYSDTPDGERNYETTHFEDAFVHGFNDEHKILKVASWDYLSWGCGHTGNEFLLNFELCQDYDHDLFLAGYDKWIWQAAYALYIRKLGVVDGKTLWSHKQVADTYHDSDHQDPIAYLKSHGKTWSDVVADVTNYYNQFEEEEKMLEELTKKIAVLEGKVQVILNKDNEVTPDWAKDSIAKALLVAKKHGQDFEYQQGSYDFHRIVTILDRIGILDIALQN